MVGFVAVFVDITRKGALPEAASVHTTDMTAMGEIQRGHEMGNIQL